MSMLHCDDLLNQFVCYECGNYDPRSLEPAELFEVYGVCHECGEDAVVTVAQLIDLYKELIDENLSDRRFSRRDRGEHQEI